MNEQIFSLAVLEALPGKENELLSMLRELYTMMQAKGYCRDSLYRDAATAGRFVHLRCWASAVMRTEAQNDPEVHRYWQKLPQLCTIPLVDENLDEVFQTG